MLHANTKISPELPRLTIQEFAVFFRQWLTL